MECAALLLLNPDAKVALAGSKAPVVAGEVERLLKREVAVYDEWCAARGLARIAWDVFTGKKKSNGAFRRTLIEYLLLPSQGRRCWCCIRPEAIYPS